MPLEQSASAVIREAFGITRSESPSETLVDLVGEAGRPENRSFQVISLSRDLTRDILLAPLRPWNPLRRHSTS